mmetsp:Transcript_10692/g.31515  ORF Transcript_10692/g.31515 Transcript_10692/m.31515 type:complete len:373 (-) Transcript_10692:142-1260(-)
MNGLAPGWFDFQVGSLLSVLDDELGLGDQTFLLLSADHGPERPWPSGPTDAELNNMGRTAPGASGDKHTILEGGLLVPFLLRWRGAPAGTSTACATSHLDLLPTIAALAGVDVSTYSHVTTDTPPPRSPISPRPLAAAGLPRLDGGVQRLWLDGGGAAAGCTPRSREGPPLLHHSKDVLSVHSSSLKLWVFTRAGLPSAGGGAAEAQLWHAAIEAAAAEKAAADKAAAEKKAAEEARYPKELESDEAEAIRLCGLELYERGRAADKPGQVPSPSVKWGVMDAPRVAMSLHAAAVVLDCLKLFMPQLPADLLPFQRAAHRRSNDLAKHMQNYRVGEPILPLEWKPADMSAAVPVPCPPPPALPPSAFPSAPRR